MRKYLSFVLTLFVTLGFNLAHAEKNSTPQLDSDLVGVWGGEFAAMADDETCSAYMWRMTRKADGTYTYHAFDTTQTILDDTGKWWTDKNSGQYFETVEGQSEEPTIYSYAVTQSNLNDAGTQIEFKATKPANKGECTQSQHFSESKMNP